MKRIRFQQVVLGLVVFFVLAGSTGRADEDLPIVYYKNPGERYRKKLKSVDLTPYLGQKELSAFAEQPLTEQSFAILAEHYRQAVKRFAQEECGVRQESIQMLQNKPRLHNAFWEAVDCKYDHIQRATEILCELIEMDERKTKRYYHLAIALAIVWDTPDAIQTSRYYSLWGFKADQFGPVPGYKDLFKYYTNPKFKKAFGFKLDKLPWPVLVHLADQGIGEEERIWALKTYFKKRKNLLPRYRDVTYDEQKIETKRPNIGHRPYTLMNILKYNGICGDQAHFASRIAKSFAVPSMKVSGRGRYGGRHAWAGFLVAEKGAPVLKFSGRYRGDMYYTGQVFDPQTRTRTLDRYVQQMYAAASKSYRRYIESLTAEKLGRYIFKSHPGLSCALAKYAVNNNVKARPGWLLLMKHIEAKNLPREEVIHYLDRMVKKLSAFPDTMIEGLEVMMAYLPLEDQEYRQRIYEKAMKVFKKRPDLQVRLRIAQCNELVKVNRETDALRIAVQTCMDHAKESVIILPLVEQAVLLAKKKGVEKQAKKYFKAVTAKFPKMRGKKPAKAYEEYRRLMEQLEA